MEAKLAKNIFFSVICSLLLLGGVLGVVFGIIQRPDTTAFNSTYTESANAVVVSEIWNGSTFDSTNTQTLFNMLCNSSSGSISTLSSNIGSSTINATTLRGYSSGGNTAGKSIVVTLGGFKWIVTYLFKDSDGNVCATLWMADANGKSTYGNSSSYYGSGSQWTSGYPASMYGTSYVAVATLNNGGTYANITANSTVTSTKSYTCSSSHQYAAFTHSSGGIRPYIVQPNKVPYQTSSQGSSYNVDGCILMNESLATNLTGYYSSNSYQGLTGYTNWGDDYLWLPSLSETGCDSYYPGMWQISQAERANSTAYSWSRSGYYVSSSTVYYLYSSGDYYYNGRVNISYAIRPALHLNLTAVAKEMTKVSITLDKQSGVGGADSVYAYPGEAMSTIDTPVRAGYTFGGYYSSTNGDGTQYYTATGASAATYPSSGGPTILYAKWTAIPYTITYNANGGTLSGNNTMTVTQGSTYTLPNVEKAGYSAEWIGEEKIGTPISTAQQLFDIRKDLSGSYYLTNDIDLSTWGNWEPIGAYAVTNGEFTGVFDGCGYTIKNMSCVYDNSTASKAMGLFGATNGATIKNIIMQNVSINLKAYYAYAGGVVGYAVNSTITNCKTSGAINSDAYSIGSTMVGGIVGNMEECTLSYLSNDGLAIEVDGNVGTHPSLYCGGVSGNDYKSEISYCINSGTITVSGRGMKYCSGISAVMSSSYAGIMNSCYNLGNIVINDHSESGSASAVMGIGGMELTNCFSTGTFTVTITSGTITQYQLTSVTSATLTNSYYLSGINSDATAQGTAVSSTSTLASNFYNNLSTEEKANWSYTAGSYPTLNKQIEKTYITGTPGESKTFDLISHAELFTAQYTVNTYTLALNGNGASNTVANQSVTFGTGKTITNSFTRAGYTFSGWATSASGSAAYANGVNFDTLPVGANNNGATITLYAVWNANTYYVKYNCNGATSGSMNNSTHKYGTASNLTNNGYSKTGYTFAGWATSSTGTVAYNNGASVSTLTTTNGATVELFAKWTANTYTVIYNANGGSGTMQNSSHTYDIAKNLSKNTFTRDGYLFLGWSTSNSATTPTYTDEQSVTNLATSGTVNLYAVWRSNVIITASSNNSEAGTVFGAGTYEKNAQVTLIAAGAVGYALLYWAELDANGDEVAQFVDNPLQITATESKTYKAYFGKAVEGIGVSATKGGVVYLVGDDFDSLEDNDTVTLCAKLVLEGYTFSHWEDINGNNLGTEMSVKLKKSVVMDNLITAVFVSATNNNVNNNTNN